ncbi:MAG TPA: cell division ATP-binding protein FtsE [Firmicutes bacterium]|nr:cell division ATP-binding protein FtsE [Bacillota bacterium]HHY98074.1 cell division ATP-binding protein FtsE [Bacillota bacterium]
MIRMNRVSKVYPNKTAALVNVDLSVRDGEFVFLVGPSGAGKTTFLNLLVRHVLPTTGHVIIDGKNICRLKPWEVPYLRRRIGMIFQDFKLLPNKTVFENIAFALRVMERPNYEIWKRVSDVLRLVGLQDKAKVLPQNLSGGEQQRVSIARAIVKRPDILLADEPTGNLDIDTSFGIMELLEEINRNGTTVIMATHNKAIVDRMKRRVVEIDHGRIVRDEDGGAYKG